METILEPGNILDVTLLEPRLKHPTIFAKFDALKQGESFILHNDHDPKPLYYQLLGQRGNIFSWEYLQQGPETWQIEIRKNVSEKKEENSSSAADNILNVTLLEPKLKHPTIFNRFDELKPGESLTLHNDHDPKPLYYQLLGERGDIFTWDYLEQGPSVWKIKITKRDAGIAEETLGEIAVKDLRKAEVFKKYGLDFCCGGKKTVKEACAEKGIDVAKVEQDLKNSDSLVSNTRAMPYNDFELDFLATYIENMHHSYVKRSVPDLRNYAAKVAKVHGDHHPELIEINKLTQEICDEMTEHMAKEESILFKYIKDLVQADKNGTHVPGGKSNLIETEIQTMEAEHDGVGRKLEKISELSNDYTLPADSCASYAFLFKSLQEFESDLHIHIHLENNILFPKALKLEKK